MNRLRTHKYGVLLGSVVFMTIVGSFGQRQIGPVVSEVVATAKMLMVFLIVFERRAERRVALIALVTGAAAFAARYGLSGSTEMVLGVVDHSAALLLVGFATFVILRNIFGQRVVGTDDVLGAVCGYILAAGAWADLFLLVESFLPGSFSVNPALRAGLDTWNERIAVLGNVSLGSLTSIGSSAAVAVQPPATILVPLEALFGQFYIAVVVAQLVGARLSQENR